MPASLAARTRFSVPQTWTCSNVLPRNSAMIPTRWMTESCPRTAASPLPSTTSPGISLNCPVAIAGFRASAPACVELGSRTRAVTVWPSCNKPSSRCRPTNPVAPVRKTCTAQILACYLRVVFPEVLGLSASLFLEAVFVQLQRDSRGAGREALDAYDRARAVNERAAGRRLAVERQRDLASYLRYKLRKEKHTFRCHITNQRGNIVLAKLRTNGRRCHVKWNTHGPTLVLMRLAHHCFGTSATLAHVSAPKRTIFEANREPNELVLSCCKYMTSCKQPMRSFVTFTLGWAKPAQHTNIWSTGRSLSFR